MVISCSDDIFKENMSDLMQHIYFIIIYLDDLLIISSKTFEDHLNKIEVILKMLSDKGLRVSAEYILLFVLMKSSA
jgi:hypothetical protein